MARKKKVVETIWNRDITHHIVATMAVFGLVVSSLITTIGVATLGVEAQVAFAQNEAASQAAAAFMGDNQPVSAALLPNSSSTPSRPPMDDHHVGSTTNGDMDNHMSTSSLSTGYIHAAFCPKIARTISRGSDDATTTGDIGQLQMFLANHFSVTASTTVSGHFGPITQGLLEKFQEEQGIVPAPSAGPLTRAAIARLCNPSSKDPSVTNGDIHRDGNSQMSSSTQGRGDNDNHQPMGTTTSTMPAPHHDMIQSSTTLNSGGSNNSQGRSPNAPLPPTPVSYNDDNASNAASMVNAVSEIGDGYTRLFEATLASFGL